MKLIILIISILFLSEFSGFAHAKSNIRVKYFVNKKDIEKKTHNWSNFIRISSNRYKVDKKLIQSIIYAESSGNPHAKSSSNAIGLMQIKPSSAGAEVYRLSGKTGQPSVQELYNPKININIGTAYLGFLQKKLGSIKNKDVIKYATILSYVNGASALLKIFSKNNKEAIARINTMNIKDFCTYVKKNIQQNKHIII